MGHTLTPVSFVNLDRVGEVTECSMELGHLCGQFVTVQTVVGHRRASFEERDDGALVIRLDNGQWAVLG